MINCPTCKRPAPSQARYCNACYTVFPSESVLGSLRVAVPTARPIPWKVPSLLLVAVLGTWFLQIDQNDWDAEPGSYRAIARDTKRRVTFWFDKSTGFVRITGSDKLRELAHDLHSNGAPAGFMDNAGRLPCALGEFCEVVIRFDPDNSAAYVIERPNGGQARIFAVDSRGTDLLNKSTNAHVIVAEPDGGSRSISMTRKQDKGWTIGDGAQLSDGDATAGHPHGKEGV